MLLHIVKKEPEGDEKQGGILSHTDQSIFS